MDLQVSSLPLKDGSTYEIQQDDKDIWKQLYPNIDLEQELKNCLGWNLANPARRKTKRGAKKHINGWLARANSKGVYHEPNRARTKQTAIQNLTDRSWAEGI